MIPRRYKIAYPVITGDPYVDQKITQFGAAMQQPLKTSQRLADKKDKKDKKDKRSQSSVHKIQGTASHEDTKNAATPLIYRLQNAEGSTDQFIDQSSKIYNRNHIPILNQAKRLRQSLDLDDTGRYTALNPNKTKADIFDTMVGVPGYFRSTYIPHLKAQLGNSKVQIPFAYYRVNSVKNATGGMPILAGGDVNTSYSPGWDVISISNKPLSKSDYYRALLKTYYENPRYTTNETPGLQPLVDIKTQQGLGIGHQGNHGLVADVTSSRSNKPILLQTIPGSRYLYKQIDPYLHRPFLDAYGSNVTNPKAISMYTADPAQLLQGAMANHQARVLLANKMRQNPQNFPNIKPEAQKYFIDNFSKPFDFSPEGKQKFIQYINFVKNNPSILYSLGPQAARFIISVNQAQRASATHGKDIPIFNYLFNGIKNLAPLAQTNTTNRNQIPT